MSSNEIENPQDESNNSNPPTVTQPTQAPSKMAASPETAAPLEPPPLSPRAVSDSAATTAAMSHSSTPLGNITAARSPPTLARGGSNLTSDIQARMKAFHLGRQGAPPTARQQSAPGNSSPSPAVPRVPISASPVSVASPGGPLAGPGGVPAGFKLPGGKPMVTNFQSAPAVPSLRMGAKKPSLAEKRGLALPGGLPAQQANGAPTTGRKKPGLTLSQMGGGKEANGSDTSQKDETKPSGGTMMDKYAKYLDAKTGTLRFKGKAVLNAQGVEFSSGSSFSISLDEVDTLDELGKGNYGTVYKVRHSRPKIRRPGHGLAGNKFTASNATPASPTRKSPDDESSPQSAQSAKGGTGLVMAMKEIRLELDDAKFAAIIMELDILHRCISPYIIDFYGAFFQEGAVYICIEFMDGGSIDKLYGDGIPENVLRKITLATTMGLKTLKEDHNIIHRDVKPTNILMNTRGQVKICDFGVSGNLVASFAKTNIGCQSYMAPERISTGGIGMAGANPGGGTYSVQSDIWSLGLTIIECAMGRYPYPPETYNNIFSQLSAIVDGDPPDLPEEGFSGAARNFVRGCLNKIPKLRPTYAMLLQHAWLAPLVKPEAIMEEDEEEISDETPASEATGSESDSDSAKDTDDLNKSATGLRLPDNVVDQEVAEWVLQALEKRQQGKLGKSEKPALHAAPLDAVVSPVVEKTGELNGAQPPPGPAEDAA